MSSRLLIICFSILYLVKGVYAQSRDLDDQIDRYLRLYIYEKETCCEGLIALSQSTAFQDQPDASARGALLRTFCYNEFTDDEPIRDIYESVVTVKGKRIQGLYRATRARIHTTDNEYLETVQAYHEALELLDPDLDKTLIGLIHLGIGVAHYANDTYPKAYSRLHTAYDVFERNQDTLGMIDALDWMANSYARDSMMVKADSVWSAYGRLASQIDNDLIQFYLMQGKGFEFSYESMHDSSVSYFEKSYERSHSLDSGLQTEALVYLLEDTRKAGDDEKTLRYFDIFLGYRPEHKKTESEARAHYAAAQSHASSGDHEAAYSLLMVHDSLDNANWNENTRREIIEYEAKYEAAQKDLTIERSKSQRNLAYLLTAGLLSIAGFFLYRYRKNQKLTSAKIENLEKQQKLMALDYMVQGQEEERRRIAQDLHDGLGGLLASARLQIQKVEKEIQKLGQMKLLTKAESMIDDAHMEVRRISHDMMPGALMDLGLVDAVEDLVEKTNLNSQVKISLTVPTERLVLDDKISINLYRAIQELINNTVKHASAEKVQLEISKYERGISIKYEDDGVGFDYDAAKRNGGIGLESVESRVSYLGGTCVVSSQIGNGSRYKIEIPMS